MASEYTSGLHGLMSHCFLTCVSCVLGLSEAVYTNGECSGAVMYNRGDSAYNRPFLEGLIG